MFDVIVIDFSRFSSGFTPGKQQRHASSLAFVMGAVAALLAGACVAPVVIQVVLFCEQSLRDRHDDRARAALLPRRRHGDPVADCRRRPRDAAEAGAVDGARQAGVRRLHPRHSCVLRLRGVFDHVEPVGRRLGGRRSSVEEQLKTGWHANLGEGLDTGRAARQKPVLIDMWATWCKNCLTMDKTTLKNEDVKAALDKYVRIKFQAEDPDEPPAKPVMQRFNAVGLPAYVILKPKGLARRQREDKHRRRSRIPDPPRTKTASRTRRRQTDVHRSDTSRCRRRSDRRC